MREVEPIVKRPRVIHKLSRREEIVLARIRIGAFPLIKERRST